jgi:ribonuclease VapC
LIVLDGSALFAILLDEPQGSACEAVIERERELLLSAGSLTELLVVAAGKGIFDEMVGFINSLGPTVEALTADRARAAGEAYRQWGKGRHPASLNICDVFAYALAKEHDCPLLFVGNDFALTDVTPALA